MPMSEHDHAKCQIKKAHAALKRTPYSFGEPKTVCRAVRVWLTLRKATRFVVTRPKEAGKLADKARALLP